MSSVVLVFGESRGVEAAAEFRGLPGPGGFEEAWRNDQSSRAIACNRNWERLVHE